jgi:hypothetical protein
MKGVKHYTKDGKEFKGATHKMDGELHSGKSHTSSSKVLVHEKDLKKSPTGMVKSPTLLKLSASCKAAARRKFKVYPSAYANIWASKTQKKGKC